MSFKIDRRMGRGTFYAAREQVAAAAAKVAEALQAQAQKEPGNPWLTTAQLVARVGGDPEVMRYAVRTLAKRGVVQKGIKPGQEMKLWALAACVLP